MSLRIRRGSIQVEVPAGCGSGSIPVSPGGLTQTVLNNGGANATFCLTNGTYRLTSSLTPLTGQSIVAENSRQAVISGSNVYSAGNFTLSGGQWFIGGQTQAGSRYTTTEGIGNPPELGFPEQVFMDDVPLLQVLTQAELSSGEFYFDYTNDRIWIADNPSGHVFEIGTGVATAFAPSNSNVTLEGLVIEKFNTPALGSAVHIASGWRVTDCDIGWNYGSGLRMGNDNQINGICEFSRVHDNRYAGVFGGGTDNLMNTVEVDHNAWGGFNTNWESSGSKFVATLRLTLTNCHFHDNRGAGFWTDIDNIDTTINGGTYENNGNGSVMNGKTAHSGGFFGGFGIVFEIGYGGIVQNATVRNNRGHGIVASNERDLEITGCTVRNNGMSPNNPPGTGQIYGWSNPRGNSGATTTSSSNALQVIAARYGNNPRRSTRDFNVHNNTIGLFTTTPSSTVCGIESQPAGQTPDPDDPIVFQVGCNNRWQSNNYEFASSLALYEWQDVNRTGLQWKSGTFTWTPFDSSGTWT